MKIRYLPVIVLLTAVTAAQNPQKELEFARSLGRRGLSDMANQVLDGMIKHSSSEMQRYGRYGKALLIKDEASLARGRFLGSLARGTVPKQTREEVLKLFTEAKPDLEAFSDKNATDENARFVLAELLMEYAEMLMGVGYPDSMKDKWDALSTENSEEAKKLFEGAIKHLATVRKSAAARAKNDESLDNPDYVVATRAGYMKAGARLRMALMYPSGTNFQYFSELAAEELDEFSAEHYNDSFGAFATLDLGRCYYERAVRLGDSDDIENAINYFSTLYETLKEDADNPDMSSAISQAFYWHAKACNAAAMAAGKLKKADPSMFEKSMRTLSILRTKVKHGANSPWTLLAMLEIGESFAGSGRFTQAVGLAGDVLSVARVGGHRDVTKQATERLTRWVGSVSGAGTLDAALLLEVGDSLSAQERTASAITFYEKAVAASKTAEQKEKVAYPARAQIARAYRADKRYFAAAAVAWDLVEEFLKSGEEEESEFGQHASNACNTARLAYRTISAATKRSKDESRYEEVKRVFRDNFPGHPENSDAAFGSARETYGNKDYERAATELAEIPETSKSYWRAQRLVPMCYWRLAAAAERKDDTAAALKWWTKMEESANALIDSSKAKSGKEAASALQHGMLMLPIALSSAAKWQPSLDAMNAYFAKYPNKFVQRGLEMKIKIEALIELKQIAEAEKALAEFRAKLSDSSHLPGTQFKVIMAMREWYSGLDEKEQRDVASRTADLLEEWVEKREKDPNYQLMYLLGETLKDAGRWKDASTAYDAASGLTTNKAVKQTLVLRAAEMAYRALLEDKTIKGIALQKALAKTRQLFLDVIIPDKAAQDKILKTLSKRWMRKDEWSKVKRNASALKICAELLAQTAPTGVDGRQVAVRLISYMHTFTRPVKDPQNKRYDDYIKLWWDGAELQLQIYQKMGAAGRSERNKKAAQTGYSAASKWIFQYRAMDGEARVVRIKALASELKRLR